MNYLTIALLAAGLGSMMVEPSQAQTSNSAVSSEVAGFLAFEAEGSGDAQNPQLSYKSIGLVNRVEYQGQTEFVRSRLLKDAQATWTADQFNPPGAKIGTATHYLEITSGPATGVIVDIIRTDSRRKMLTLGQPLPPKSGPKVTYRIRRHWTLATLFGTPSESGLVPGDAAIADKISIFNGKGYDTFFYSNTEEVGTGWRRVGRGSEDQAGYKIYPDDALLVQHSGATPLSKLVTGLVKSGRTSIPVHRGTNIIGNVYPTSVTLAESRLYSGSPTTGVRSGNARTADKVQIYNGTDFDTYYYQVTAAGRGWRKSGDPQTDVGSTEIPAGGAIVIKRGGTAGFNWKPSP